MARYLKNNIACFIVFMFVLTGFLSDFLCEENKVLSSVSGEYNIFVELDNPKGIYNSKEDIKFLVTVKKGETPVSSGLIEYKITLNGIETLESKKIALNGKTVLIPFTFDRPGWLKCYVVYNNEEKIAIAGEVGLVVEPKKFIESVSEPDDLDAFWSVKKEIFKKEPLNPDMKNFRPEDPDVEFFTVMINTPGSKPVQGYYTRPKSAKKGSCPAVIFLRAAGVSGHWCMANSSTPSGYTRSYGAIALDINAHGIPNKEKPRYYSELEKGELANYPRIGMTSRETFYFLGMYLRLMRSIEFLASQPEWDGKHIIAVGESQGGGQALAISGLDTRVSAVFAILPALCDLSAPLIGRLSGWPWPIQNISKEDPDREKVINTVKYFDNVYLVKRAEADFLIMAGLIDMTCPPTSVYSMFNNIKGSKRIVIFPHATHNKQPEEDKWLGSYADLEKEFINKHIKN